MAATRFDVLGIGNAIVDVLARTEDDFLIKQKMHKGSMQLIDEARAQAIYDAMGPAVEISGGSAANTTVGVASLGARAAFVGKVKDDELGHVFAHDIRAAGVAFGAAKMTLPLAMNVSTSSRPSFSNSCFSRAISTVCPPTLIARRNATSFPPAGLTSSRSASARTATAGPRARSTAPACPRTRSRA